MIPSVYQQDVYNSIRGLERSPGANLAILARAGSGKTTTIVEATKLVNPDLKTIFLAFNKNIAEELQRRVPDYVMASTLNSFGWRVCTANVRRPQLKQWKTDDIFKRMVSEKEYKKARSAVKQLIGLLKAWAVTPDDVEWRWEDIVKKYGVEVPNINNFGKVIGEVLFEGFQLESVMDFDDQLYFPIVKNWKIPEHDYVFVDEAQDLNPIQIELVSRLAGQDGHIIAVGDDRQAIYAFRGADPDAFDTLVAAYNAKVLPLSICYRCPKAVIRLAQNIVPDIEFHVDAPEGIVKTIPMDEMRAMWKDDDFILCRTTAPLIGECLKLIRQGKKATVRGRDIGANLIELLEKVIKDFGPDISDSIERYRYQQTVKLEKLGREAELLAVNDKCDTIMALYMDTQESESPDGFPATQQQVVNQIRQRIESIFSDNASSGIKFSTVHRAKGLEEKRVFILEPHLMPHPSAKQASQIKQEMNLKYVAYTRAKEELYIAGGKSMPEKKSGIKDVEIEYVG